MLRNLSNSYTKLDTYMNQVSTGKKINRPSDDPVIAMKGMNYRSQVIEVEQYIRNTNEVHNWMDNSDSSLDKATSSMQKLRELAIQASNSTYGSEERKNIKEEVVQLKEHLIDIANTKVNGKYIFNGTNTETAPIKDGEYNFSGGAVNIEVSNGIKIQANVDASSIFGKELFDDIDKFIVALDSDDQEAIQSSIDSIDDNINNVINARASLGARMNRLDLIENRLNEQNIIATKMMSENEDVDYEKVITDLITQESLHRAALAAGSRIIQPSLIDFLR
ncbi:flagellar hook-associated protein 3 FlgL [Virgibacillus halotolerans]|nr:flagellar hook-associated protein 3 FlgL [Virgibacillus halotolerans]